MGNPTNASYSAAGILLSDARLKRDITRIGQLDDDLSLYSFRYLWSDPVYVGVMAQEVALVMPSAVVKGDDGYLRVDYASWACRCARSKSGRRSLTAFSFSCSAQARCGAQP